MPTGMVPRISSQAMRCGAVSMRRVRSVVKNPRTTSTQSCQKKMISAIAVAQCETDEEREVEGLVG